MTNHDKAQVLIKALPYIQKYFGKIVVIKYGGNAMTDERLKDSVMSDLILLTLVGVKVVLVHGGGPEISDMMSRMGMTPKFVGGLRYTDAETAKVVQMVLAGKTNKDLVALLQRSGGRAIGLCGIDGGMIKAKNPVRAASKTMAATMILRVRLRKRHLYWRNLTNGYIK